MAVLRCGRARFAHGDRSEAAAVVPLDMPNFLRSGKNLFPRNYIYRYKFSREMIVDWYCLKERERGKIGGPGTIIQVDESKFGRRKYNRGRRIDGHWVLGLIENNSEDFRLIVCPNNIRDAATHSYYQRARARRQWNKNRCMACLLYFKSKWLHS